MFKRVGRAPTCIMNYKCKFLEKKQNKSYTPTEWCLQKAIFCQQNCCEATNQFHTIVTPSGTIFPPEGIKKSVQDVRNQVIKFQFVPQHWTISYYENKLFTYM